VRARAAVLAITLVTFAGCSGSGGFWRNNHREPAHIARVIDGDTVEVRVGPDLQVIRLLSIDSPEKSATRYGSPEECGSLAASAFMERYRGARVMLQADPTQDRQDRYGRLLRYLELPSGVDLGALEVKRGLAMPYIYRVPAEHYGRYQQLARRARYRRVGIWGWPCRGDFHSSVPGVQNGL